MDRLADVPPKRGQWKLFAAVAAVLALVAVWIDLGDIHTHQNADSIVPVLVSLYRWTPFYWEQDRLGMLFPLLAMPVRNPLANMLVQYGLATWLVLSAIFLAARYVLGTELWIVTAAVATVLILGFGSSELHFEVLMCHHEYGTSMALGITGLLLLDKAITWRRWLRVSLGVIFLFLSCWVNMAAAVWLIPLVVARRYLCPGTAIRRFFDGDTIWTIVTIFAAFAAILLFSQTLPYHLKYAFAPVSEWPTSWLLLGRNTFAVFRAWRWLAAGLAVLTAATLTLRTSQPGALGKAFRTATPFLAAALANVLFMAGLEWVKLNFCLYRYLIPSVIFCFLAAGAFINLALFRGWNRLRTSLLSWLTLGFFVTVMLIFSGWPSIGRVRTAVDMKMGELTAEVNQAGCTHIMGDYWKVWPAVFHANLTNYQRGDDRVIWGIAFRSAPTRELWFNIPSEEVRIAVPLGDEQFIPWLTNTYGLYPLVEQSQLKTIRILKPR